MNKNHPVADIVQLKKGPSSSVVSLETYRECHNQKCKTCCKDKRLSIIQLLIDSDFDTEILKIILTMLEKSSVIIAVFITESFL